MNILTYWFYHKQTGLLVEKRFNESHLVDRPWFIDTVYGEYVGLKFEKANVLIQEWNKLGNDNGYFYYLHRPEIS